MNKADNNQIPMDRNELKKFGLTIGTLIAAVFGLFLPWLFNTTYSFWPWLLAIVFILWALVSPLTLKYIYIMWMRSGLFIGRITTPLFLGIVFYLVITPTGLVMRMLGRDVMRLKAEPGKQSYRQQSKYQSKESLERPF